MTRKVRRDDEEIICLLISVGMSGWGGSMELGED